MKSFHWIQVWKKWRADYNIYSHSLRLGSPGTIFTTSFDAGCLPKTVLENNTYKRVGPNWILLREVQVVCSCTEVSANLIGALKLRRLFTDILNWGRSLGSDIPASASHWIQTAPGRKHNLGQGQFLWKDSSMSKQHSTFLTTGRISTSLLEDGSRWWASHAAYLPFPPQSYPPQVLSCIPNLPIPSCVE